MKNKNPNLPIWWFGVFRLSPTPEADNRKDNHDQQDQNHCYNDPCYSPILQTLLWRSNWRQQIKNPN